MQRFPTMYMSHIISSRLSDHSEPVVAHGVMADRLFSAQSVQNISLTCVLTDRVILTACR